MILMARKTPFLARKSYLKYFTQEEIREAFDNKEDNRVEGRVYCSKRAFDMWLSKDIEVSDQTKASIDVLYKQSRDMVSSFFSYEWKSASIEVGYLPKSRKRVQTRIPLVEVPPQYRQAVVIELLAPGSNIYSEIVTENYMETLRPILKNHLITGMHFVEQARILLNLMDPRYKWVPTVNLDDSALALHSHCVFGANWKIVNLPATKVLTPSHSPNIRGDLILMLKTVKENCSPSQARKELSSVTYKKESLADFLQKQQDTPAVQYLKSLLKIECTNQFEYMGYRLIIQNPVAISVQQVTQGGIHYKEYPGEEMIHFSNSATKGYFRHNGPHVSHILMTLTDRRTITETMAMIGCYCKWQWRLSQKLSIIATHRECKETLLKNPEQLIGVSTANWSSFMAHIQTLDLFNPVLPVECEGTEFGGTLKIVSEAADPQPSKVLFEVNAGWTLICRNPKAIIKWEDTKLPCRTKFLSPEWDTVSTVLIPILAPSRSFPRTLTYHITRKDLYDDITKYRFQVFNDHCLHWLSAPERDSFSTLAKTMLREAARELQGLSNV
nr:PB2 [Granville quaranjavirus]